ncbi:hypothetical protein AB0E69_39050 [Kribbella sp. NPDC026611]|uniref:hypothetical protein n=1 Tax=Kribbella sp. NPDC026611 TaxID=3154911 RepID=UPI0033D672D3
MTDTETRLRDYLHAAANTIPDTTPAPALHLDTTTTSTRPRWLPMTLAAASIGAVLVLLVPFLTGLAHKGGANSAATPTPAAPTKGPVSGAAPRIPYTVTVQDNTDNPLDTWWRTLYDHGQTVKNPGTHGNVLGRFGDDSWLIETGYPKYSQLAVLDSAGKVRPLGPKGADGPKYSPDREQLAAEVWLRFGTPQAHNKIVVLDLGTGREVTALEPPVNGAGVITWAKEGIILGDFSHSTNKSFLWQPGKGQPQEVHGIQSPLFVQAVPATGKLLDYTPKGCPRIGVLRDNAFVAEHEYCGASDSSFHAAVSPDGRTLFSNQMKVALDLYTGATTALRLPGRVESVFSAAVFEDPTNLIAVAEDKRVQRMYRCSVATGECKVLRTAGGLEMLGAVKP